MERGDRRIGVVAVNRNALLRAMMLALTVAGIVSCQNASPEGPGGSGGELQAQKAEILKQLSKGLADIQKRQSCVQAANDPQALGAPHAAGSKRISSAKGRHPEAHERGGSRSARAELRASRQRSASAERLRAARSCRAAIGSDMAGVRRLRRKWVAGQCTGS